MRSKILIKRLCISIILLCFIALGGLTGYVVNSHIVSNPGEIALKLMYDFNEPEDLVGQYEILSSLVTPEVAEELEMDDSRTIDFYYKFKYSKSQVEIVSSSNGIIYYHLINDNIDPEKLWVFDYELDKDGKISSIKEYEVKVCGSWEWEE